MNIHRILFPTDFSENSGEALDYASRFASESGALLYILHVDELLDASSRSMPGDFFYVSPWDDGRPEVRAKLAQVVPSVDHVAYEHRYVAGSPVAQILEFAERQQVELIVMGSHGRTGFSRLLMGSVAEGVMRRAQCPVLIVKQQPKVSDDVGLAVLAGTHD